MSSLTSQVKREGVGPGVMSETRCGRELLFGTRCDPGGRPGLYLEVTV